MKSYKDPAKAVAAGYENHFRSAVKAVEKSELSRLMIELHDLTETLHTHLRVIHSMTRGSDQSSFDIPASVLSETNLIMLATAKGSLVRAEQMARLRRERLEIDMLKWVAAEREWKFNNPE